MGPGAANRSPKKAANSSHPWGWPVLRSRSRAAVAGAVLLACLVASASAPAQPALARAHGSSVVALPSLSAEVLAAVNQVRREHGRQALTVAPGLTAAAQQHSIEMAKDGYFAHESKDGTAFWKRIQAFYRSSRSSTWMVGENLVYAAPALTAEQAVNLWLRSPEHRRNLLDPRWQQMGVAAVQVADAGGVYGGQTVTVVTNDFGARSH
jgi:uncharacterized protein YkwD